MNKILMVFTIIYCGAVSAQSSTKISDEMTPKQSCYLMSGTLSMVAMWRDNNVPEQRAQSNVDSALKKTVGYSEAEKQRLSSMVGQIYASKTTALDIQLPMRQKCKLIPPIPNTMDSGISE